MSVRVVTPDVQKAKAFFSRAEEFFRSMEPIMDTAEVSFLLKGEYDILQALVEALLAADGEKVIDADYHKALIQKLAQKYITLSPAKIFIFDELRKIRNDINYYGQKDKKTLEDFYKRNKETIKDLRKMLFEEARKKIQM